MSEFIGQFQHSLDAKGRLSVPRRFRQALAPEADGQFIVTLGLEGCLQVYPRDEWRSLLPDLRTKPTTGQDRRFFSRVFVANAEEAPMDAQGRILVPKRLADQAGLDKEVVIVGGIGKWEIWSPERWGAYLSGYPRTYEEVVEKIAESEGAGGDGT